MMPLNPNKLILIKTDIPSIIYHFYQSDTNWYYNVFEGVYKLTEDGHSEFVYKPKYRLDYFDGRWSIEYEVDDCSRRTGLCFDYYIRDIKTGKIEYLSDWFEFDNELYYLSVEKLNDRPSTKIQVKKLIGQDSYFEGKETTYIIPDVSYINYYLTHDYIILCDTNYTYVLDRHNPTDILYEGEVSLLGKLLINNYYIAHISKDNQVDVYTIHNLEWQYTIDKAEDIELLLNDEIIKYSENKVLIYDVYTNKFETILTLDHQLVGILHVHKHLRNFILNVRDGEKNVFYLYLVEY